MTLMYTIYNSAEGAGANLIFSDGTVQTVDASHPHYDEIKRILGTQNPEDIDEDNIRSLLTPAVVVSETLTRLSERVTFDGVNILFDGDVLDNAIAEHIIRIIQEGGNADAYAALVAFLEKLAQNPSEASRESLYAFIVRHNITIDPDGDFYVYKGLRSDGTSIHSGFGIVNGKPMNGHLPNNPGTVVEMPRSKVDSDTRNGCSTGLHAGTYRYASSFAQGKLVTVKVNPRDVVSVPDDCSYQKLRVSRYKVITQTEMEIQGTTHSFNTGDPISEIEDLVAAYGVANIDFTYTRGNGDKVEVRNFNVYDVFTNDAGDLMVDGEDVDSGETHVYRSDFMSNITINSDVDDDIDDDDLDYLLNHDISDLDDDLDDEDGETLDIIIHRVNRGEQVRVDFDYLTVAGEARRLRNFLVTETRNNNNLIVGVRDEDGEVRSYRVDRISGLYARS